MNALTTLFEVRLLWLAVVAIIAVFVVAATGRWRYGLYVMFPWFPIMAPIVAIVGSMVGMAVLGVYLYEYIGEGVWALALAWLGLLAIVYVKTRV
jgi:hypothetical protein